MRSGLGILVALLLAAPRMSAAQTPAIKQPQPDTPRIYLDVNLLGYADPLGDAKTFESYALKFGEVATFKASYPEPSRSVLFPAYVGGGFMLTHSIGVGVSYSHMSRSSVVDLSAEIPDPVFPGASATGTGTTGTALSRDESAIHISLAIVPVHSRRVEFRMMGGPSLFMLKGDMVREVNYEQTFDSLTPQNAITIDGMSSSATSGSALGYHVGADVTYFVHRFVGMEGGIRYGHAIVAVDTEPLSNISQKFLVGGTTVFFGLRFRIGPWHFEK